MKKTYKNILAFLLIGIFIIFAISSITLTPRNKIIKQDKEYIYVKKYKIFGLDSCIYRYSQPITYNGIITDNRTWCHFVGIPGKGGHMQRHFKTVVQYSDKTYTYGDRNIYNNFHKGDSVKVTEIFYPIYDVSISK